MESLPLPESFANQFDIKVVSKTVLNVFIPFLLVVVFKYIVDSVHKNKTAKRINSALSFLPGPRPLPLIGNVLDLPSMFKFQDIINTGEKYGPIFRMKLLNVHVVIVSSASIILPLLKSNKLGHTFKPPILYASEDAFTKRGVIGINGNEWRVRRKMLMPTMSKQSHQMYANYVNKHCTKLIQELKTLYSDGQFHAPSALVSGRIVALTCEMLTGVPMDNIEECIKFHLDFKRYGLIVTSVASKPWLVLPLVNKLHPIHKEKNELIKILNEFVYRRLKEVYEKRNLENQSVAEMSLGMVEPLIDNNLPTNDILDDARVLLIGGYETIAATMNLVLMCLALYPEHQELCRKEVDEVFEEINGNELSMEAVKKMKYLEMCISETLRLYPVVFGVTRLLDEPWQIDYKGETKEIPEGTLVTINMIGIHRNSKDQLNPHDFDPSRFSPENISQHGPPPFIPFSTGIRGCYGVSFIMPELKMITGHLLRNFRWTTNIKTGDVKIKCGFNLIPERDIDFKFVPRAIIQP